MVPAIRYLAPAQVAVLQQTAPKNTGILLLFCTVAYYLQMQGGCREGIRLPGIIVNFSWTWSLHAAQWKNSSRYIIQMHTIRMQIVCKPTPSFLSVHPY